MAGKARVIFTHLGGTFPHRIAEWMLGFVLLSWGLILLHPAATFDLSPAYLGLQTIASEEAWGWGCTVVGAVRLLSLFINGFWVPPTFHIRSVTSVLSTLFWFSIVYGMIMTGAATTGLAVYPWLLATEVFCTFRTARDYRISLLEAKAQREYTVDDRDD